MGAKVQIICHSDNCFLQKLSIVPGMSVKERPKKSYNTTLRTLKESLPTSRSALESAKIKSGFPFYFNFYL